MAEMQGIKLFGQTILLKVKQEQEHDHEQQAPTTQSNQSEGSNMSSDHDDSTATHKRPDKIIPCPRCKSMETKFCYFNNYNVNQPRHFCKGCQRYWTAGGALRNVPVGAGRRRSKPNGPGQVGGFVGDGCFFDGPVASGPFDVNGVVVMDEWELAAAVGGGFGAGFPVKRRRHEEESPGQTQTC